jgi:hypothetical protein
LPLVIHYHTPSLIQGKTYLTTPPTQRSTNLIKRIINSSPSLIRPLIKGRPPCLWLIKVSWNWDPKLYLFTILKIMKTTHCNHRCFRNELHCAECRLVYRFLIPILPKYSKHHVMNERIIKSRTHVSHFFYFKKKYACALDFISLNGVNSEIWTSRNKFSCFLLRLTVY